MTRLYSVIRLDLTTKRFFCHIYGTGKSSIVCEISAVFSGFSLKDVQCCNFCLPPHFVSVEISTFLSRCQSFLTGRQECFEFDSSERF